MFGLAISQALTQESAIAPTRTQACDIVIEICERRGPDDSIHLEDCEAVDEEKFIWIEQSLQRVERLPDEIDFVPGVQLSVVAHTLNLIYVSSFFI